MSGLPDPPVPPPPIPPDLLFMTPDVVMSESSLSPPPSHPPSPSPPPLLSSDPAISHSEKAILKSDVPPLVSGVPISSSMGSPILPPASSSKEVDPVDDSVKTKGTSNPTTTPQGFNWATRLPATSRFPKSAATVTVSANGTPRVKVPNAVFERGARLHSDYIVGIFYGNSPSYGKVWGVLNYLWGKDKKVTIHNLTKNAFLFHIPSISLRQKILQHELWRVGDAPFFVTEWKASFSLDPPSLQRAPIWATINNIPFDLVTNEGLSVISKPLGEIIDAKPFTSINSAEIKVIVDLTKQLPIEFEIEREDGNVVPLSVTYPWLPPLCPVCNEIGHKAALCPKAPSKKESKATKPSTKVGDGDANTSSLNINQPAKGFAANSSGATGKTHAGGTSNQIYVVKQVKPSTPISINQKGTSSVTTPLPQEQEAGAQIHEEIAPKVVIAPQGGKLSLVGSGEKTSLNPPADTVSREPESSEVTVCPQDQADIFTPAKKPFNAKALVLLREKSKPIESKNAFGILQQECDSVDSEPGQELTILLDTKSQIQHSPSNSSSSKQQRKKKRKMNAQNSPGSGGAYSLTSGSRHQN